MPKGSNPRAGPHCDKPPQLQPSPTGLACISKKFFTRRKKFFNPCEQRGRKRGSFAVKKRFRRATRAPAPVGMTLALRMRQAARCHGRHLASKSPCNS
jgi:hypothetical protein